MNRRMRVLGALLVVVLALTAVAVGCSSSNNSSKPTPASGPVSDDTTPTTAAPALTVAACALAKPDRVKAILGESAAGVETDHGSTYKSCTWKVGASDKLLAVGVIRTGNGDIGFGRSIGGLTETGIQGLGDQATFSTGLSGPRNLAVLVVNKGSISLSVTVSYPNSLAIPASTKAALTAVGRAMLKQLGA